MRRSTTSAGTEFTSTDTSTEFTGTATSTRVRRRVLAVGLLAELGLAAALLTLPVAPAPPTPMPVATPSVHVSATAGTDTRLDLPGGRTVQLLALGGPRGDVLLDRIRAELAGATDAVTAFWGPDWPREIVIVAAGSADQFRVLAGGAADIAATTTAERITFAPGAADMSRAALRIVLRHELFHYAARSATAVDAPRWLTEGVADYVGRPPTPIPPQDATLVRLPTDADLDTPGAARSLAYDRAWWFARYVAEVYGAPTLRELYLRACGVGHPDLATAVREALGADLGEVVADWRRWRSG